MRSKFLLATVLAAAITAASASLGAASPSARLARAASVKAPKKLTGARITRPEHTLKPGKIVHPSSLGQRVYVNAHDGFALAAVGQAQYPAETTDGGASWKTFGPALHVNAAQAPLAVTSVGAANAHTVYYYGAGQAVDVTSDGGKTWWRTLCSELSLAVVPGVSGRLVWITQDSPRGGAALTWPYESTDGGRVWHYTTALGGGF
jgi:photosystem II stability/assembly factor-like uncharacterized protein